MLYAGVAVFIGLAAFTARSIWVAWQERSDDARAAAVFDLVARRTPVRPTDAPGAMAWLQLELERRELAGGGGAAARSYARFAASTGRVPEPLAPLVAVMRAAADAAATAGPGAELRPRPPASPARPSLREQQVLDVAGRPVVVTRRKPGSAAERAPSDAFIAEVAPRLARAAGELDRAIAAAPLPPVPGDRPPRPVRLYAVSEDGTLVSAPWPEAASDGAARELALLSGRPGHPAFAPEEFFFGFDPAAPGPQAAYSGFYLDVGGRGLVSTLLVPFATGQARRGVLALDLAFEVAWSELARGVAPPVIGAAIDLPGSGAGWAALAGALPADAPGRLRAALAALATGPAAARPADGAADDAAPLRQATVEAGALAAFQVSDRTWLVMVFPAAAPAFPVAAVALLAGVLAMLFTGFEVNRRRAEAARRSAERAFAEKQNLLDTMQVPLVVVDPNTDAIVTANRAAEAIGVRAGSRFADLVWPEPRARAHYERMQVASPEPRRAYGVPVAIRDDAGVLVRRYAVVRSVAVTAPIEALAADQRHRLGVVFVLDRDDDLALLADDIATDAHRDERRRLAGLLSHGVDTLARVLEHVLRGDDTGEARGFAAWLADYLERRLTVTAWLLDHWSTAPPLPHEVAIDRAQAAATLARLASVFDRARRDRGLRARLHWDNGALAGPGAAALDAGSEHDFDPGAGALDVDLDWPADYVVTCPVRGGFGLFVGELVTNAIRHGRPGTRPRVQIRCDRVRKQLVLTVDNAVAPALPARAGDAYGGLAIVRAMARLFGWAERACGPAGDRFIAEWALPASEGSGRGDAD